MSTISQFAGSGVKQIITGYVNEVAPTNAATPGSGEDLYYYDIVHGGTLNASRCTVSFDGVSGYPGYGVNYNNGLNSVQYTTHIVTTRLTSPTNLRLAAQRDVNIGNTSGYYHFTGRFTIVEYF